MGGSIEKKWFVYLGDHHEGPFAPSEIQMLMSQGRVSVQSYVWAEGMSDWRPLAETGELTALLLAASSSVSSPAQTSGSAGGGGASFGFDAAPVQGSGEGFSGQHELGASSSALNLVESQEPEILDDSPVELPTLVPKEAISGEYSESADSTHDSTNAPSFEAPGESTQGFSLESAEAGLEVQDANQTDDNNGLNEAPSLEPPAEFSLDAGSSPEDQPLELSSEVPLSPAMPELDPPGEAAPNEAAMTGSDEKTGDLNPEDLQRVREMGGTGSLQSDQNLGDSNSGGENQDSGFLEHSGLHQVDHDSFGEKKKFIPKKLILFVSFLIIFATLNWVFQAGYLNPLIYSPQMIALQEKAGEGLRSLLVSAAKQVPYLERWASPIPQLPDTTPGEFEKLKDAVKSSLQTDGPRFAVALSQTDLTAPSFHVASNMDDTTKLTIHLIGVPDTLIDQIGYYTRVEVTLEKHLAKTPPIRFPDGNPIPRGQYNVYVTQSDQANSQEIDTVLASARGISMKAPVELPRDKRILAADSYFLGGTKDQIYFSRLKEFHDRLTQRAAQEVEEVRQFILTLEGQLASSDNQFRTLKSTRTSPRSKKIWADFHVQWTKLQDQILQITQRWTAEVLAQEYFYGSLYYLVQQAGGAVKKVHDFHEVYFRGVQDIKAFEIQLGEALASAQSAISILKAKAEQAQKLPPTANGMPRRDGI